jgi:hypothetical protein
MIALSSICISLHALFAPVGACPLGKPWSLSPDIKKALRSNTMMVGEGVISHFHLTVTAQLRVEDIVCSSVGRPVFCRTASPSERQMKLPSASARASSFLFREVR